MANRVIDIQSLTPSSCWFYVPTKLGPVDIASPGALAPQVINDSLLSNGYAVLVDMNVWPGKPVNNEVSTEQKTVK